LAIGRKQLRVVMRAEADADVPEPEEADARSGRRRRDVDDEVTLLRLEASVLVRAPAGVAEGPALARVSRREPNRPILAPPRCRRPADEEHERSLVRRHEQRAGADGVAAK